MRYILPALMLTLVFGGFAYWQSIRSEQIQAEQQRAAKAAARQAFEDEITGARFLKMEGSADALADIQAGKPRLLLYGRQTADLAERTSLFRERMGITVDPLAGCMVSDPLVKYADDYNRVIDGFIVEQFGADAKRLVEQDALELWRAKRDGSRG